MANFAVHFVTALAASGLAATSLLVTGLATPGEFGLYFALGTVGGLAPDVDSNNSTPLRLAFNLFSVVGASLVMLRFTAKLSVVELCLLWAGVALTLRYGVFWAFNQLTIHRGVFHSIPAALLFGFITTVALYRLGRYPAFQSWIAGSFVTFGYLVHLTLDELYSVNLYGVRFKRSFGTALKFTSPRSQRATLLLYLITGLAWYLTPTASHFLHTFKDPQLYQRMEQRFAPRIFSPPPYHNKSSGT